MDQYNRTDAVDGNPAAPPFGEARFVVLDVESGFGELRRQIIRLVGPRLAHTALYEAGVASGATFARAVRPAHADDAALTRALLECLAAYQAVGFGAFAIEVCDWSTPRVEIIGRDTFEAWAGRQRDCYPDHCAYAAGVLNGFISALTGRDDLACIERSCQAQGADACRFEALPIGQVGAGAAVFLAASQALHGGHTNVIEQARELERQRVATDELRDMLQALTSNCGLESLLNDILVRSRRLLGADAAAFYRLDHPRQALVLHTSQGLPEKTLDHVQSSLGEGLIRQAVHTRRPIVVADATMPISAEAADQRVCREQLARHYRALLATPIIIEDQAYGALAFYVAGVHDFNAADVELAAILSEQAALMITYAQWQAQRCQDAIAADHIRLARDLHDSVTQTLFSASLIAEALPHLYQRDPEASQRRLHDLHELTRGALAEMRTLLLELRPAALTESTLSELLRHLVDAAIGRLRIPVTLTVEEQRTLPDDVRIALYRIAQEALNNIIKHAAASAVDVALHFKTDSVELRVSDNGCGFHAESLVPECMGLGIMRERAASIGAAFAIDSRPGQGTHVQVIWAAMDT